MRALALGLSVTVTLASTHCQRAPAEEFVSRAAAPSPVRAAPIEEPSAAAVSPPTTISAHAPGPARCMRPTPADLPTPAPLGPASQCPADPEPPQPPLPVRAVILAKTGTRDSVTVQAEVVVSNHDTQRGLMYRKSMAEDRGMLFDLRTRSAHEFWMHNTCIPLDMIFVDEDGFIVGIVENAPTLDDSARGIGCESRYVLEVNAGWARRHGVKAGQQMTVPLP